VVIGKSGAGKSTFINMVANLASGKGYRDQRIVAITQGFSLQADDGETHHKVLQCTMPKFNHLQTDDVNAGQAKSQTQRCSEYTFETDKYSLTLVDTPGIGDTRGVDQDEANAHMIAEQVAKMGSFDAIILVYKGDDVRKDLSVTYILSELQSMMPKDFKSNLIVVFSHVTSTTTAIPGINHLQSMGIAVDKMMVMDNECYLPPDILPPNSQDDEETKELRLKVSEASWKKNAKQYSKLIDILSAIKSSTTPLDGQKMDDLRLKKLALAEDVLAIMDLHRQRRELTREIEIMLKEIDYTQKDRQGELTAKVDCSTNQVRDNQRNLQGLSQIILSRMKDIIRLHRSIVEESMLPPSDPLEARLHREIMELTDKVDRGQIRAAKELKEMKELLDHYNALKGEKDGDNHGINSTQLSAIQNIGTVDNNDDNFSVSALNRRYSIHKSRNDIFRSSKSNKVHPKNGNIVNSLYSSSVTKISNSNQR